MQNVLNHVSDRLFHLTGKGGNFFLISALSYDVIHDVFVLFTSAKVEILVSAKDKVIL